MKVSVIIPAFNEAPTIGKLVEHLQKNSSHHLEEIIVSDGGSEDDTFSLAAGAGARAVKSPEKGRALQMNYGASLAKGDILYFVHADTIPPDDYAKDIVTSVSKGYDLGRYLSAYQSDSWLLKINAFLSKFDTFEGMGGDQTFFITKSLFEMTGGFNNSMKIMEEFEFCARARKAGRYRIIPKPVLISARKYETCSWLNVQKANYRIVKMYKSGASQENMIRKYKEMLNH